MLAIVILVVLVLVLVLALVYTFRDSVFKKKQHTTSSIRKLRKKDQIDVLEDAQLVPVVYEHLPDEITGSQTVVDNVPVWTYFTPGKDLKTCRILFVFHGNLRNASDYLNNWKEFADASKIGYIIICPEFSQQQYPNSTYMTGNVLKDYNNVEPSKNTINPESDWLFSTIEPIFEHIRDITENQSTTYDLWGHSAGAQFLHRLVMLKPNNSFGTICCANSGFYTQPTLLNGNDPGNFYSVVGENYYTILKYPYGLYLTFDTYFDDVLKIRNAKTFDDIENKLNVFASRNMYILLGKNDNGQSGSVHGEPQPAPRSKTQSSQGNDYKHKTWWTNDTIWTKAQGWTSNRQLRDYNRNNPEYATLIKSLWSDNRYSRNSRGKVYYYGMQSRCLKKNVPFKWTLQEVENVGHDSLNMGRAAYKIFDPSVTIPVQSTSSSTPADALPNDDESPTETQ